MKFFTNRTYVRERPKRQKIHWSRIWFGSKYSGIVIKSHSIGPDELGQGRLFFLFIFSNSIITGLVEFVKDFLGFFFLEGYRKSGHFPETPVVKSCQISSVWMNKPSSVEVILTSTWPPFLVQENLNLNFRFRFSFQNRYGNRVGRYNVELSPVSASLVVLLILEVSG